MKGEDTDDEKLGIHGSITGKLKVQLMIMKDPAICAKSQIFCSS